MTSGSQLLLIFQFPGLSEPLAKFISSVHDGVGCRKMDMDVASGLRILFLTNGPLLPVPVWIAQILGDALVLASFHLGFLV